ncbi:probable G-protein coupled receptor B0563.6 isoform X3 [Odontomachus brunneus]|uniref:probable G-protein coupled receptor B0563.6 isoform X3 n=1 Tax=Odontomachus brunneus TaxID=486640 RepID=UPI0013F246AF|nr:probable G-protein coupled receptor B0563.6 isoform X3 [Odontomachus brunneus]
MLTGVIDGTLLCCEDDNFTVERVSVEDDVIRNRVMSLVWTSYGIIVPIILIVGIFGNVAILIVLSSPVFRGIAYLYLSGLALAHIGVALSWITITLRLGYGMSARIRTGNARKNVSSFILSSFIAGFVISIPLSFMRITYEEQDGPSTSFTLRENVFITRSMIWRAYIWAMEIVVRICPSILFIILNSFVIMRFLQLNVQNRQFHAVSDKFRTNNAPDTSLLSRNRGYIEEQHLAILTTTMILCFFITTIPSSLVPILYPNRHSLDLRYQTFRVCSAIVELSNYAIYILIYLVCSTEFRKGLLRFLQGRCNENMVQDIDQPVGEIEDFSRHGTTVRLTPEHTKLNSPESPTNKETRVEEDSHALDATASMLERRVIA